MTVEVPILNDEILEDDELFTATLSSDRPNVIVDADRGNANVTIFDNDRELFLLMLSPMFQMLSSMLHMLKSRHTLINALLNVSNSHELSYSY